jgi:endo-1,4-beta-D-glucanase Y
VNIKPSVLMLLGSLLCASVSAQTLLEHVESESGTLLPGYTGKITAPFAGVGTYGNGDGVEHSTAKLTNAPGKFRIDIRGASNNASAAGISIYVDNKKVGAATFANATASVQTVNFQLDAVPAVQKIRFSLETDNGSNDTFLDWYELFYVGAIAAPPPPPTLPSQGAYYSGTYRNMFAEAGYSQTDITTKINAAYNQLFHSANKSRETGEAILIDAPNDSSMAYIWDTGNDDVRSEGMSYGMMMAVQLNNQTDFNKIWAWANKYSLNKSGEMQGYFGWQKNTDGSNRDVNPAPDGEEYFVTALFFASHRWGDGAGIYNYKAEANKLLDNMYKGVGTHYVNSQLVNFSLFDSTTGHILFSPYGTAFSDPSYHLPAFYELWSRWATNNKSFWAERATASRAFLKNVVDRNGSTGLNSNYANFDGSVVSSAAADHKVFFYDAWRTIGNAATDYHWWKADEWQVTYAKRLHSFLKGKGIDSYPSLYNLDGSAYNNNADHSAGLVGQNAMGALASDSADAWGFVNALWNTPVPTGRYRYYDGTLYLFSMMALSGNYRVYCPNNACSGSNTSSPPASSKSASSVAASSKPASSKSASSVPVSSVPASSKPSSSQPVSSVPASSKPASSKAASSSASLASLTCKHVILDEWGQGFTAGIRITNNGTTAVNGWSLTWRYTDGSVMTNSWNANITGSNPYTATPLSWLVTINPGQTIEIGAQVNKGVPNTPAPTPAVTGPGCN